VPDALGARRLVQFRYLSRVTSFSVALCRELRLESLARGVFIWEEFYTKISEGQKTGVEPYEEPLFEVRENLGFPEVDCIPQMQLTLPLVYKRGEKFVKLVRQL
jgi:hypothetical protein